MALRRSVKNVVKNFSDIEVKVREATSNDPWGPSSSLMGDIADATYNVTAFSEIMGMLWKRLNDHGKNWRHVYKSLTVLEYIIKTGSERVAQQCRENIFAIQTLKDFQYIDKDGKDQGMNVREKSKQLVGLLKDEDRLKNERQRALKAKERFAQSQGGVGNSNFKGNKRFGGGPGTRFSDSPTTQDDSSIPSSRSWEVDKPTEFDRRSADGRFSSELEKARPSNEAEEEMQLQIALAMSKEEADKAKQLQTGDEERFKLALRESQQKQPASTTFLSPPGQHAQPLESGTQPALSTLLDLSEPAPSSGTTLVSAVDPWTGAVNVPSSLTSDPWVSQGADVAPTSTSSDPWSSEPVVENTAAPDPWSGEPAGQDPWTGGANVNDPYAATSIEATVAPTMNGFDPRGLNSHPPAPSSGNPFDLSGMTGTLPVTNPEPSGDSKGSFLGENSRLVNLDNILGENHSGGGSYGGNPFATNIAPKNTNPFMQDKPKPKSINELRVQQTSFTSTSSQDIVGGDMLLPAPLIPRSTADPSENNQNTNPFM